MSSWLWMPRGSTFLRIKNYAGSALRASGHLVLADEWTLIHDDVSFVVSVDQIRFCRNEGSVQTLTIDTQHETSLCFYIDRNGDVACIEGEELCVNCLNTGDANAVLNGKCRLCGALSPTEAEYRKFKKVVKVIWNAAQLARTLLRP